MPNETILQVPKKSEYNQLKKKLREASKGWVALLLEKFKKSKESKQYPDFDKPKIYNIFNHRVSDKILCQLVYNCAEELLADLVEKFNKVTA